MAKPTPIKGGKERQARRAEGEYPCIRKKRSRRAHELRTPFPEKAAMKSVKTRRPPPKAKKRMARILALS
jgi:hypothetical protein